MKDLVLNKAGIPVTTTLVIAEGMQIEHRAVIRLVRKYVDDFKEIGGRSFDFESQNSTSDGGRPTEFAWLTEDCAIFLITLMRNSDLVIKFKKTLSVAFANYRKIISQLSEMRSTDEWIGVRNDTKITRKEETDIIKKFVEYATGQGSQSANRYYMNITSMENQALFFISEKYPNLRDMMDASQLLVIGTADQIVAKALRDGMEKGLPYKEIYILAKDAVTKFSEIIGKSPLPKIVGRLGNNIREIGIL